MPFAGAVTDTIHIDLKSVEGGWVELRRMTYGQKLQRQSEAKLGIDMSSKSKDIKGELAMVTKKAIYDEYKNCVVDHNLFKDFEETAKFNFANPQDVDFLDPRIGEEINKHISDLNNFEETEEAKN